jgi:2-methylcitrate dehydratase
VADPEIERLFPAMQRAAVKITMRNGAAFSKQLDYPKGDARNPLTDAEIEEKFRALADEVLSKRSQDRLIAAIWNLDKCASVAKLMALMKSDKRIRKSPIRAHR